MSTVRVAAAIICREGRVLAAQRATGAQAGRWELPGGKVEEGETGAQALRRELREELGCELGAAWPYDTIEHDYPDFHLTMDVFVTTLPHNEEPRARPEVHSELRWLAREELLGVAWLEADEALARSLTSYWDEVVSDQML